MPPNRWSTPSISRPRWPKCAAWSPPGGRIVIIDKNSKQWGRLKTPEWEKWFGQKELEKLLARHCAKVSSRAISYWEDVAPDGLFLAWLAER